MTAQQYIDLALLALLLIDLLWLHTGHWRTQDRHTETLRQLVDGVTYREVNLGGGDVVTYAVMPQEQVQP